MKILPVFNFKSGNCYNKNNLNNTKTAPYPFDSVSFGKYQKPAIAVGCFHSNCMGANAFHMARYDKDKVEFLADTLDEQKYLTSALSSFSCCISIFGAACEISF